MIKKNVLILFGSFFLLVLIFSIFQYVNQPKVGFIDYNKVYNNCKMKLDLEKDLQKVGSSRKSELDSLQLQLSILNTKVNSSANQQVLTEFEDMKRLYLTLQENYEKENVRLKETYFNQIREDINEKAVLFSEKNGFDFLMSKMSDGGLLYGSNAMDVTKEFKNYLDKL